LVLASHILANQGVLDGFGQISVRSAKNPKHYFMARSLFPPSVTRDDIMEFDENSQPIDQRGRELYGERFIHGEPPEHARSEGTGVRISRQRAFCKCFLAQKALTTGLIEIPVVGKGFLGTPAVRRIFAPRPNP
jgi:hypothetical protein